MTKTNTNIIESVVAAINDCATGLKIEPGDLQWNDLQTFLSEHSKDYGISWGDAFKHKLKQLGGFRNIKDANFYPKILVENTLVLAKARQNRYEAKDRVQTELLDNSFHELLSKSFTNVNLAKYSKPVKLAKSKEVIERNRHSLLSDLHFGSDLEASLGCQPYGIKEEARSLAQVIIQDIEFKQDYNSITRLYLNINGDLIAGKLHDKQAGAKLAEQFARATWLLYWAIYRLATEGKFAEIVVNCASGNHDRDVSRHVGRATNDKWDGEGTKIYFALKMACSGLSNVTINIPKTPWVTYSSFGANYYGTHGDSHINPGNPGKNVNVGSLEDQINRLNASLLKDEQYKVVFLGHVHAGMLLKLNNGVTLITNPPLIPSDEYAQSIGYWTSQTGQWVWESVKGFEVGDSRFLKVDEYTRNDESLDKFIPPWQGF